MGIFKIRYLLLSYFFVLSLMNHYVPVDHLITLLQFENAWESLHEPFDSLTMKTLTLVLLCPDIYGVKDVLDQYKYHLILIK